MEKKQMIFEILSVKLSVEKIHVNIKNSYLDYD